VGCQGAEGRQRGPAPDHRCLGGGETTRGFLRGRRTPGPGLPGGQRERTVRRLRQARALVGSTDALERFDAWRAPEER